MENSIIEALIAVGLMLGSFALGLAWSQRDIEKFISKAMEAGVVFALNNSERFLAETIDTLYLKYKDNFIDYENKTHKLGNFKEQIKFVYSKFAERMIKNIKKDK